MPEQQCFSTTPQVSSHSNQAVEKLSTTQSLLSATLTVTLQIPLLLVLVPILLPTLPHQIARSPNGGTRAHNRNLVVFRTLPVTPTTGKCRIPGPRDGATMASSRSESQMEQESAVLTASSSGSNGLTYTERKCFVFINYITRQIKLYSFLSIFLAFSCFYINFQPFSNKICTVEQKMKQKTSSAINISHSIRISMNYYRKRFKFLYFRPHI